MAKNVKYKVGDKVLLEGSPNDYPFQLMYAALKVGGHASLASLLMAPQEIDDLIRTMVKGIMMSIVELAKVSYPWLLELKTQGLAWQLSGEGAEDEAAADGTGIFLRVYANIVEIEEDEESNV